MFKLSNCNLEGMESSVDELRLIRHRHLGPDRPVPHSRCEVHGLAKGLCRPHLSIKYQGRGRNYRKWKARSLMDYASVNGRMLWPLVTLPQRSMSVVPFCHPLGAESQPSTVTRRMANPSSPRQRSAIRLYSSAWHSADGRGPTFA